MRLKQIQLQHMMASALTQPDYVEALGISEEQLAKILDPGVKDGLTDPDDVPEPPDAAIMLNFEVANLIVNAILRALAPAVRE